MYSSINSNIYHIVCLNVNNKSFIMNIVKIKKLKLILQQTWTFKTDRQQLSGTPGSHNLHETCYILFFISVLLIPALLCCDWLVSVPRRSCDLTPAVFFSTFEILFCVRCIQNTTILAKYSLYAAACSPAEWRTEGIFFRSPVLEQYDSYWTPDKLIKPALFCFSQELKANYNQ